MKEIGIRHRRWAGFQPPHPEGTPNRNISPLSNRYEDAAGMLVVRPSLHVELLTINHLELILYSSSSSISP